MRVILVGHTIVVPNKSYLILSCHSYDRSRCVVSPLGVICVLLVVVADTTSELRVCPVTQKHRDLCSSGPVGPARVGPRPPRSAVICVLLVVDSDTTSELRVCPVTQKRHRLYTSGRSRQYNVRPARVASFRPSASQKSQTRIYYISILFRIKLLQTARFRTRTQARTVPASHRHRINASPPHTHHHQLAGVDVLALVLVVVVVLVLVLVFDVVVHVADGGVSS